jgi:hypothetical protein
MIARHRGDLRVHSRWSPSTPASPPSPPAATEDGALLSQQPDDLLDRQGHQDLPRGSQRKPRALIALATIVAVTVIAGQQHTASAPAVPRLPSTPQQWVSRWTAATLQSPAEVCDHLYAPALSRAFKGDTNQSCTSYYTSVKSISFRIRHVLQDGATAAVEAQEVGAGRRWGYFTMVLGHVRGGWQAVDVVPGRISPRALRGRARAITRRPSPPNASSYEASTV